MEIDLLTLLIFLGVTLRFCSHFPKQFLLSFPPLYIHLMPYQLLSLKMFTSTRLVNKDY